MLQTCLLSTLKLDTAFLALTTHFRPMPRNECRKLPFRWLFWTHCSEPTTALKPWNFSFSTLGLDWKPGSDALHHRWPLASSSARIHEPALLHHSFCIKTLGSSLSWLEHMGENLTGSNTDLSQEIWRRIGTHSFLIRESLSAINSDYPLKFSFLDSIWNNVHRPQALSE